MLTAMQEKDADAATEVVVLLVITATGLVLRNAQDATEKGTTPTVPRKTDAPSAMAKAHRNVVSVMEEAPSHAMAAEALATSKSSQRNVLPKKSVPVQVRPFSITYHIMILKTPHSLEYVGMVSRHECSAYL